MPGCLCTAVRGSRQQLSRFDFISILFCLRLCGLRDYSPLRLPKMGCNHGKSQARRGGGAVEEKLLSKPSGGWALKRGFNWKPHISQCAHAKTSIFSVIQGMQDDVVSWEGNNDINAGSVPPDLHHLLLPDSFQTALSGNTCVGSICRRISTLPLGFVHKQKI